MLNYRPDSSELNPNVLVSVNRLLPNTDGSWRVPFAAVASSYANITAGTGIVKNAFFAQKPSGASRLFAATSTKLLEANTGTLVFDDVSFGGGAYTSSTGTHFCQVELATIACNKENDTQYSESGAFAPLSGAPRALVCETLEGALLLWNVVVNGTDVPDGLAISDIENITEWEPDPQGLSNLAYQTQLTDCPGEGTAMIRFRDFVVIFKRRGMWIAQFVGPQLIWDIRLFSADVGCMGKDACIVAGDRLYFADDNNVWEFDGATLRSISDGVQATKTIMSSILNYGAGDSKYTEAHYDDVNKVVSFYPGSGAALAKQKYWAFNTVSQEWGYGEIAAAVGDQPHALALVRAPFKKLVDFTGSGMTVSSKENRLVFVVGGGAAASALQSGHGMALGIGGSGSAVTAYFGSPFQAQVLKRIFMNGDSNTGVTVVVSAKRAPRSSATTQATSSSTTFSADMIADLICPGHFFKITWSFDSTAVLAKWMDYMAEVQKAGTH